MFILCLIAYNNVYFLSDEKKIDKQELMFLMGGGVDLKNSIPNPGFSWLLDKSWDEICRLDKLNAYIGTYI